MRHLTDLEGYLHVPVVGECAARCDFGASYISTNAMLSPSDIASVTWQRFTARCWHKQQATPK